MSEVGFMETIERIVAAAGVLNQFRNGDHFHIRIPNDGYMDLVVESWSEWTSLGVRRISVAHYYESHGDLVPDPDIEMNEAGMPLNITLAPPGGYSEIRWEDAEGVHLDGKTDRDVREFMKLWQHNLIEQGFIEAAEETVT